MNQHYAFTAGHLNTMPGNLRALIGKHFAGSRWQQSCDFYNHLPERYRATVVFHAGLNQSVAVYHLEEMETNVCERVIGALDELRRAFAKYRKHETSNTTFIQRLSISERKSLFFHAGLSAEEFNQPIWRIESDSCEWKPALIRSLQELLSAFEDSPAILTSIKPEIYTC
ncbi:replication protein B [Prodigiosinella aquatilis]|nr:replication protein B [Prodigiosinella sp. LS101]WJV52922.1 replication protein B [Prodigiosinella sp. LS101]WJV57277.1 replication protein B [Pectobacteriaceae bacterium C111]